MLPVTNDRDTAPFFEGLRAHQIRYAACLACDHAVHPPMPYCPTCGTAVTWQEASGPARLRSASVCYAALHPAFPPPFTVVLVAFDDPQIWFAGYMTGTPDLIEGQRMYPMFEDVGDTVVLRWSMQDASG